MRIQLLAGVLLIAVMSQACGGSQPPPAPAQAPVESTTAPAPPAESAPVDTRDLNLRAYVELLRSDVRAQKVAIITELMEFTEAEDAAFWPIYREYELELASINDERVSAIQEYADNYQAMSDALADKLATTALKLESRRTAVKSKYYDRLKVKLSPKTAARFLQVENQLLLITDLQISASLPVLQ